MERGRGGGRDDLFGGFGDPFGGNFGGFGGQRSLVSSFFNGRDPFDDPFFARPFGNNMFGGGSSMMLGGGPSMFGPPSNFFGNLPGMGFIDHQQLPGMGFIDHHQQQQLPGMGFIDQQQQQHLRANRSNGPVIEEIVSGDEGEEEQERVVKEKKYENPRKHSRSSGEPYVEEPDDGVQERRIRHMQHRNEFNRANGGQPQTQSFSFQSSTVSYGGANGAYYTSSTSRKMGDNGVMIEEKKEADTTTGKAEHRISKGLRDKGHSLTRKLNPDGKVDTMQTLHNLNEDELAGFEETWKGNAKKHLPGWTDGNDVYQNIGPSSMHATRHGWALPSNEQPSVPNRTAPDKAKPSRGRG